MICHVDMQNTGKGFWILLLYGLDCLFDSFPISGNCNAGRTVFACKLYSGREISLHSLAP
jgi:hypothetical protein